jgi:DIS3-like exonuclease 1
MDFKRQRALKGALELHSSEVDFDLVRPAGTSSQAKATGGDDTSARIEAKAVMPHESLPVMEMVAEFMIAANSAVAKQIYTAFPQAAALRRHPLPRSDRFDELIATAALQGITLDASSNATLAASLAEAARTAEPVVAVLLKTLATRAMTEAEYFSTGDFPSPEAFYHYGLAAEFYTHFTSPIRRYADVVVHRLLLHSLAPQATGLPHTASSELPRTASGSSQHTPALPDQCRHMNMQHRMAKQASELSQQLFFSVYFRGAGTTLAEAVVSSVRANGCVVYVPQYEVHGHVYMRSKHGAAFVPVGDGMEDAREDHGARLEFEHTDGQKRRLVARGSGRELWAVKPFDHILVNISSEQPK